MKHKICYVANLEEKKMNKIKTRMLQNGSVRLYDL